MKNSMIGAFFSSLLVLGLFGGWLYYQQPAMIFYPVKKLEANPRDWGLDFEEVILTTEDGIRLHGWYLPHSGANRTLLFFHGNAGNISHRGDSIGIFHRLGLNVFIFDYRGYGLSEGKPSEEGLYADARAAWQYLVQERKESREHIIFFGRSLGGAVAANLAAEAKPGALILESTFDSAAGVARTLFPVMSHLTPLRFNFNTAAALESVTAPVLVIHSEEDEIIPFKLGQKAYAAANPPKAFVRIRGGHNDGFLRSQPAYEQALAEFIAAHVPASDSGQSG